MKEDFYDNIPIVDEGHCLSNKDVGLNPSKKSKNLGIVSPNSDKDGYMGSNSASATPAGLDKLCLRE